MTHSPRSDIRASHRGICRGIDGINCTHTRAADLAEQHGAIAFFDRVGMQLRDFLLRLRLPLQQVLILLTLCVEALHDTVAEF